MQTSPRSGILHILSRQKPGRGLRAAAAACALLAGSALSAQAQYVFEDEILPPRAVAWRLNDRGFTGIGRPRFDGGAYIVEAFDPRGDRVRLVVAPDNGAILGRQRLDVPVSVERPARPAAGYGWTEEEFGSPRRRDAERLVPPGRIPMPEDRGVYAARPLPPVAARPVESVRREPAREAAVADPTGNPLGLNPDAAVRQPPQRRAARTTPPTEKPQSPRLSDVKPPEKPATRLTPEAPRPAVAKAEPPKPEAPRTETAKIEAKVDPKADAPKGPAMPAAQVPPSTPAPTKAADLKPADKPADPGWKDPPEAKRNVRVIGGATIVPGTTDKESAAGN